MMIDKRNRPNREKRNLSYVERELDLLQLTRACFNPNNYLRGALKCQS